MDSGTLYYAGFAAGLIYLLGDITGGLITPGYNYISNAVSELVQSGAENRRLLSVFFFTHAIMIVLFSIGILLQHPFTSSGLVFAGGILLLLVGTSHALSSSIFPQDPVGVEMTIPGMLHLILVGLAVISIFGIMPLLGIGLKREFNWKSFKLFTFLCLFIIIVSGISTPILISEGIQLIGLTERITGYTFYFWLSVLSYLLINKFPEIK